AALKNRARLRAEDEILRRARARTPLDVVPDELRRGAVFRTRALRERDGVADDERRGGDAPHELLIAQDRRAVHHLVRLGTADRGRLHDDLNLVVERRILNLDLEHEAVELRLGQRVRAFLLDRVLRREDEKRQLERKGLPAGGDFVLLHRLEQRRLSLRRRPVDLVGEENIGEDRSLHELERAPAGRRILLKNIGAGDIRRHQVRRELDAIEVEIENLRERADEQRLREAGDADEQAVAAREKRGQHLFDDFVLSDDHLADLREHGVALRGELLDRGDLFVVYGCRLHRSSS